MSFRVKLLIIVGVVSVLVLLFLLVTTLGSAPAQSPRMSLTCLGVRKVISSFTGGPELMTCFSLSNATPQRWHCKTKAIEYSTPTGPVTNRSWGSSAKGFVANNVGGVSPIEVNEEYIFAPGQVREFYVPGVVTNNSLVVRLECQGKARGLLGRFNDFQDKTNSATVRTRVTPETFSGKWYHTVLSERAP